MRGYFLAEISYDDITTTYVAYPNIKELPEPGDREVIIKVVQKWGMNRVQSRMPTRIWRIAAWKRVISVGVWLLR